MKIKEEISNSAQQEKPCNHFMVWNIQGGYSYYRCDKCNYIDGKKTFAAQRQEIVEEIEKLKKRVVKEMPNWKVKHMLNIETMKDLNNSAKIYNQVIDDIIKVINQTLTP